MQLHGGNLYINTGELGDFIDFSASLNPMGMPEQVLTAAMEGVRCSDHYPDPDCTALRRALSVAQSVKVEHICCGNGGAELLDRLAMALKAERVMILAPTFGEYERAFRSSGSKVLHYYLKKERDFDVTEDIIRILRPGLSLLVLCSPNNPTGRIIPEKLLIRILVRCEEIGCRLLLDESFLDLTALDCRWNLAEKLEKYPNLLLLRSMTKGYCMPGLRLGYLLCSDGALMEKLTQCAQPWSVSLPAQMAGVAAMDCGEWLEESVRFIQKERLFLEESFTALGLEVVHGSANFLLFRWANREDLCEKLKERGILLRSCASFRGLGPEWYRAAVRTREENQQLIAALSAVFDTEN